MSDVDLFVEVFPIAEDALPALTAYEISINAESADLNRIGRRIASRLRKAFDGTWMWSDDRIITDNPRSDIELMITVDSLKGDDPEGFEVVEGIHDDLNWHPSAQAFADFVVRTQIRPLNTQIGDILQQSKTRLRNAEIERNHRIISTEVMDEPAIAMSIASRLIYAQDVQTYIGDESNKKALNEMLSGLWVSDKTSGIRGEIIGIAGIVKDKRDSLLDLVRTDEMRMIIADADDSELVLAIRVGGEEYEFLARTLRLIVRIPDLKRFDVDPKQAIQMLQMRPKMRAGHVRSVSDIVKQSNIIGNAFNSRANPNLFFSAEFEMNVRFGENAGSGGHSVKQYDIDSMHDDFTKRGAYRIHDDMFDAPIRVCVVNTLSFKIEDFVEALNRYVERHFAFRVEVIRERKVRVLSRTNLESAVRVVEKEDPDIILAFFPDENGSGDDEDTGDEDANATYIKSLTIGRTIPTHAIYQSLLDDPDSMGRIVLSILGKTGNAPFVLAEPLEYSDMVIGLQIVRNYKKTADETQLTAVARIYKSDGEFSRYNIREMTMQEKKPPYVLIRDLFPQKQFANKRIILHHDGPVSDDLLQALMVWAKAINAIFYPVEIMRFGAPRIYGIGKSGVCQPTWGSAFKLSPIEALLVSSVLEVDVTPQPLRIRTLNAGEGALPIEEALRGILVWTLLAYGATKKPKLPVTITNVDQLAYWLKKGNSFKITDGNVPFWL